MNTQISIINSIYHDKWDSNHHDHSYGNIFQLGKWQMSGIEQKDESRYFLQPRMLENH